MGCRSDYMEQTGKEKQLQRTAKLLVYVLGKLGKEVSPALTKASETVYCREDYVPDLCARLTDMTPEQRESIVYDAHSAVARDLASWWEQHQKADEDRIQKEADLQLYRETVAALTPEQRRVLRKWGA